MARTTNLPTFDFIGGTDLIPVSQARSAIHENTHQSTSLAIRDVQDEELRVQLKRLQYELDAVRQERDLASIQHQEELRAVQERADSDYKRAQNAQSDGSSAARHLEKLKREFEDAQTRAVNEKAALERKVRDLQADNRTLREEFEYEQAEALEAARKQKYEYDDLKQRFDAIHGGVDEVQDELTAKATQLEDVQQRLLQRESEIDELRQELLRLQSQTGDSETYELIRKQLSEHVEYSRGLEETNRQQLNELRQFRKNAKSVELVEEEKRSLEVKLKLMHDLRKELAEEQLQRRILQDEKQSWTSYLEEQAGDQDMRYDSPEDMAKALLQERLQRLDLVRDIGSLRPELAVKEENIRMLSEQLREAKLEVETLRSTSTGVGDVKARSRLEKQRNLALKEVEYLRAQIKSFQDEEAETNAEKPANDDNSRVEQLEQILEQYRSELHALHAQMSELEKPVPQSPRKRVRQDDDDTMERLGELTSRAHTLQDNLSQLSRQNQVLEAELKSSRMQITSMKESRTRTLELRNNPTAEFETIKMDTLRILRAENADLIARLEGKPMQSKTVPMSMLESSRLDLAEAKAELARSEKKMLRLKQIFNDKSLEFREAVVSLLGWKLDFMPNGRVKATPILNPSSIVDGEEEENSIVFDGEKGTMKVSGGDRSIFAREIQGLIDFWVDGRKEIPCFLAACNLEFYDKTTRAQKM